MKVRVFLITYNEAEFLPTAVEHYRRVASDVDIVAVDNYSDDRTPDIARELGCEVITYGTPGVFDDRDLAAIKRECWKNSCDCDWVVVADCDELLEINEEKLIYERNMGTTVIKTQGYNIISRYMPRDFVNGVADMNWGSPADQYSKLVMFSPTEITEARYKYGAHRCRFRGNVQLSMETYRLMHYKLIGGPDRMIGIHQRNSARMSQRNRELNLSTHYHGDAAQMRTDWERWWGSSKHIGAIK